MIAQFLDITGIVQSGGEQGLLGLAFHPNYSSNGYFYVNYTGNNSDTYISRFSVSIANPDSADPASELNLLSIPQPFGNHNGGCIKFGPDGFLYIGMGDGGSWGDPGDRSQDSLEYLGKMLRIDVDNGNPYAVPASNPFVGMPGVLPEIWALGLRNPWRFSFDRQTGDLWIGDVGQNNWEEINFQPAVSAGGENYGWRCYEANASYNLTGCPGINNFEFPVFDYDHSGGNCSVTGGFVYRGTQYPNLNGHYLFTDYCSGMIWTVYDSSGFWGTTYQGQFNNFDYSSFGEDANGELYVAGLGSGIVYHIEDTSPVGIAERTVKRNVSVYPNPFLDKATVEFDYDGTTGLSLEIIDLFGRVISTIRNIPACPAGRNEGTITIERGDMSAGAYYFRLLGKEGTLATGKLLAQ